MQFDELLMAAGKVRLVALLNDYALGDEIPLALHQQLMRWLRSFLIVGGMPDAVRAFVESGSHQESEAVKHSILATFRDDFGKYGQRVDPQRLREVFERLPLMVGAKLKYVHIDRGERAKDLAAALHLLSLARVACRVRHTAANGIPLGVGFAARSSQLREPRRPSRSAHARAATCLKNSVATPSGSPLSRRMPPSGVQSSGRCLR